MQTASPHTPNRIHPTIPALASLCILGLSLSGCENRVDSQLVTQVQQTGWYRQAVQEVRSAHDRLPIQFAGYNKGVLIGVVMQDVVAPFHNSVVVSVILTPFQTLESNFPVKEARMFMWADRMDFPHDDIFRAGSVWAFKGAANSAGDWFIHDKLLVREAPADVRPSGENPVQVVHACVAFAARDNRVRSMLGEKLRAEGNPEVRTRGYNDESFAWSVGLAIRGDRAAGRLEFRARRPDPGWPYRVHFLKVSGGGRSVLLLNIPTLEPE